MRSMSWLVLGVCGACSGGGAVANGIVAAWQSSTTNPAALAPLPKPRANHCSAAANGRLYVIGGNYKPVGSMSFVGIDDVQVADQAVDGSLGAWRLAGTLPSALTGCTATSDGRSLYLVGGLFEDEANRNKLWGATIGPDGALGAFTELGPIAAGHTIVSSQAFVRDATLFVFDSTIAVDGAGPEGIVLLHAPLTPALGTWAVDLGPAGFRGRPQYAATEKYVYAFGGYLDGNHQNEVVTDGFGAPFDVKPGLGASFPSSALPAPRAFGAGVGVDDWVYVLGGKTAIFNGKGEVEVYAAQVGAAGALSAFTSVASLPEGRTNLDAVVLGDFLYVTGGGSTGGGLDNVFAARVRF